jgi:SAM-dependent methyltransferase
MSVDEPGDLELWNAAAATYAATVGGDSDSFYRRIRGFLWERFGDVAGLDVLDLGCGHGWLAEELRVAGGRMTGIDGSSALLDEARERYPNIDFVQHDLSLGLPEGLGGYDRVVAHMVLMDIPELDQLLADVAAKLRPSGVFVFSILHPAFYSRAIVDDGPGERYRKVPDYLGHETRWVTSFGGHQHYHRPLSWYVDRLVAHGLLVNGLHEPPSLPREDVPEQQWTDYQRWFSRIPTMLAISCVRSPLAEPHTCVVPVAAFEETIAVAL